MHTALMRGGRERIGPGTLSPLSHSANVRRIESESASVTHVRCQRAGLETGSTAGSADEETQKNRSVRRPVECFGEQSRASADRACPSTLPLAAYPAPRHGTGSRRSGAHKKRGREAPLVGCASVGGPKLVGGIRWGKRASIPKRTIRSGLGGSTLARAGQQNGPVPQGTEPFAARLYSVARRRIPASPRRPAT